MTDLFALYNGLSRGRSVCGVNTGCATNTSGWVELVKLFRNSHVVSRTRPEESDVDWRSYTSDQEGTINQTHSDELDLFSRLLEWAYQPI